MGKYNDVISAESCPRNRKLKVIEVNDADVFQTAVNLELEALGNRMGNTKLTTRRHVNGYDSFVMFIWYYEEKTEEELEKCIVRCKCCDTKQSDVQGQWVYEKFFCNACLREKLEI